MKKILFISLFFFLFGFGAKNTFACFCRPDWSNKTLKQKVTGEFISSASVFSGEVIEIVKHPTLKYGLIIKLKVEKLWKGETSENILISTANDSAACGYEFKLGKKYLVYASKSENELSTSICDRTNSLENNKDLKYLDKLKVLWESKKPIKL